MTEDRCDSIKPMLLRQEPVLRCDRNTEHGGAHRNGGCAWWQQDIPEPPPATRQDIKIRQHALEQAIAYLDTYVECEDEDNVETTPQVIVEFARFFEAYVKGEQR